MRYNIIQPYRDLPTSTNQNICGNDTLHLMWHGLKGNNGFFQPRTEKNSTPVICILEFSGK